MPTSVPRSPTSEAATAIRDEHDVVVFISYHRNDKIIAEALEEALTQVNHDRVKCFLDTKTLDSGKQYEQTINDWLRKADWLICVFTGEQSEYCGYEIGVFREAHQPPRSDGRLVCLHDVKDIPSLFHPFQNHLVKFPEEPLQSELVSSGNVDAKVNLDNFYGDSEIAKFFNQFYTFEDLYPATGDGTEDKRRLGRIAKDARSVTEAFQKAQSTDRKWKKFLQKRLELRIVDGGGEKGTKFLAVPEYAAVHAEYETFLLFNASPLPAPEGSSYVSTWGELRRAQVVAGMRTAWMDRIEKEIVAEVRGHKERAGSEITFQIGNKILQAVLGQHEYFVDGSRRISVNFIETIPRRFLGLNRSSLLLAGLIVASRFRFAHFEEKDQCEALFGDKVEEQNFRINCKQLLYDIERVDLEAAEYGLLSRTEFVDSFPEGQRATAEAFGENWDTEKAKLLEVMPQDEKQPCNRTELKNAIGNFYSVMKKENANFLLTCVENYRTELIRQIKSTTDLS